MPQAIPFLTHGAALPNAAANNYVNAHDYNNFYNMYGGYGLYIRRYI